MRIVHVATVPMTLHFLRGQAGYLRARGHELIGVASPGPDLDRFGRQEGVPVHGIAMTRQVTPARDFVALIRLTALLGRLRPDVVHAHTPKAGLLACLAATLARVPVRIYHVHGLPLATARGWRRLALAASERAASALAHHVLPVSRSVERELLERGLAPPARTRVLGAGSIAGVDGRERFEPSAWTRAGRSTRARLGIPEDAPVAGFIGRVVREKGVDELAAAWRGVRSRVPAAHLLMVGPLEPHDPPDPAALRALREDPRVHFVGMDWETRPYYAAMDVLVLPSHREGYPVVVLEAAAMARPAVVTRVHGCIDAVVDGRTGRVVPPTDAAALADALARYLCDPAARARDGARARARALAEYRPETLWRRTEEMYGIRRPRRPRAPLAYRAGR